jgi:hypothetical protein
MHKGCLQAFAKGDRVRPGKIIVLDFCLGRLSGPEFQGNEQAVMELYQGFHFAPEQVETGFAL